MEKTINCPKCKRKYWHDYILSKLVETITSERQYKGKPACEYCQKPKPADCQPSD